MEEFVHHFHQVSLRKELQPSENRPTQTLMQCSPSASSTRPRTKSGFELRASQQQQTFVQSKNSLTQSPNAAEKQRKLDTTFRPEFGNLKDQVFRLPDRVNSTIQQLIR